MDSHTLDSRVKGPYCCISHEMTQVIQIQHYFWENCRSFLKFALGRCSRACCIDLDSCFFVWLDSHLVRQTRIQPARFQPSIDSAHTIHICAFRMRRTRCWVPSIGIKMHPRRLFYETFQEESRRDRACKTTARIFKRGNWRAKHRIIRLPKRHIPNRIQLRRAVTRDSLDRRAAVTEQPLSKHHLRLAVPLHPYCQFRLLSLGAMVKYLRDGMHLQKRHFLQSQAGNEGAPVNL